MNGNCGIIPYHYRQKNSFQKLNFVRERERGIEIEIEIQIVDSFWLKIQRDVSNESSQLLVPISLRISRQPF